MPNWSAYAEAEKRGILTPEKQALYTEAKNRGLAPTPELRVQDISDDVGEQKKAIDSMVYSQELGIEPEQAYDMHEEITTQLSDNGMSFKNNPIYAATSQKVPVNPLEKDEKTALAYAPFVAVKAVQGAMSPLLEPLKVMGMDTQGLLNTAEEYWRSKLPEGTVPDITVGLDKNGRPQFEKIDTQIGDLVGTTAEFTGFLAPASTTLKAGELVANTLTKYARPFYRKIVQGMIGGGLLGEGDKDKTLEHMALFGTFEGAGYAVGKLPSLVKKITESNLYRKATIKEKGLMVQSLEKTIEMNQNISEAELARASDSFFEESLARREIKPSEPPKPLFDTKATFDAETPTKELIRKVKADKTLPEIQRLRFTEGLRGIRNAERQVEQAVKPTKATTPTDSLKEIETEFESKGGKLDIFYRKKDDSISLSRIEVPKGQRDEGIGSKAMQEIIDVADNAGATITLTPSSDFGGNVARLKKFYKGFGFVENKGANKDFRFRDSFLREPQKPTPEAPLTADPFTPELEAELREQAALEVVQHTMSEVANIIRQGGKIYIPDTEPATRTAIINKYGVGVISNKGIPADQIVSEVPGLEMFESGDDLVESLMSGKAESKKDAIEAEYQHLKDEWLDAEEDRIAAIAEEEAMEALAEGTAPTPVKVFQGRSKKGLTEFFNPDGVAWGSTNYKAAEGFASVLEEHYPNRTPPETTREVRGEVHELIFDLKNPMEVDIAETLWSRDKELAKVKEAKSKGHDGLAIIHPSGKTDYVAFSPEQVTKVEPEIKPQQSKAKIEIVRKINESIALAEKRGQVSSVIHDKKLKKVENFRKFLKLPSIKQMTMEELDTFDKALGPYKESDVFLTERQLETIDQGDLKGIRTIREAREKYSERTGISIDQLENVKVDAFDRMRYDTALAKRDPFYKVMVEDYHSATLSADKRYLEFEDVSNDLAKKARASRKRSTLDKLVPTDKMVFDYLSGTAEEKGVLAQKMTSEEMNYAQFLEAKFADALTYLIETKSLETGRENYITNIRRDFFETVRDDGIKQAGREILNQQKLDEQTFAILDQMTGDILPLNKFFQFSMKRTGGLTPSKNVAKVAAIYFKTFEKKKALDSFMPKMMVYVDVVTPVQTTETGLLMDQRLKTFVKEWINTKKGRPSKLVLTPGSKSDIVVRSLKGFISVMDLGGNIPVGIAATGGETVATYVQLGKKAMATGIKRANTEQGKKIVKEYKNFMGKTVWEQLAEPSTSLTDKASSAMFGFFTQSSIRANKTFLLGSLTKEEFASGVVSPQRLAELKVQMGEYRVVSGMKSILGATTEGGLMTQYKSWAIPILSSKASNLGTMAKSVFDKSSKGTLKSKEFQEFRNALEITAAALVVIAATPSDEKSFIGTLKAKVKREALTILGALDPTLWTATPRMMQWANEIAEISKQLILLEEYSETAPFDKRGKLKGVERAKKVITPRAIKQFKSEEPKKIFN